MLNVHIRKHICESKYKTINVLLLYRLPFSCGSLLVSRELFRIIIAQCCMRKMMCCCFHDIRCLFIKNWLLRDKVFLGIIWFSYFVNISIFVCYIQFDWLWLFNSFSNLSPTSVRLAVSIRMTLFVQTAIMIFLRYSVYDLSLKFWTSRIWNV